VSTTTAHAHTPNLTHIIVLAAGNSKRFDGDKLLAPIKAPYDSELKPIILRTLQACKESGLPYSVWVNENNPTSSRLLKTQFTHRTGEASLASVKVSKNCALGMGATLAEAVNYHRSCKAWIIALGDMPGVSAETFQKINSAMKPAAIVRPTYRGITGHPVGFGQSYFSQLRALTGDSGAKCIIAANCERLETFASDDPGVIADIDTRQDLNRYNARF